MGRRIYPPRLVRKSGWKLSVQRAGRFAAMYLYSQLTNGQDAGSTLLGNMMVLQSQGIDTRAHYTQGDFDYTISPRPR